MSSNVGFAGLKASSVNGGAEVKLNAKNVTYAYTNNLKATPIASSYELTEVEHRGWENPRITIRGVIRDVTESNEITEVLLKEFARTKGEQVTLRVVWGSTGNEKTFSNAEGNTSNGGETGIPVVIDSITFDINPAQTHHAHLIPYTLTLVEDKPA